MTLSRTIFTIFGAQVSLFQLICGGAALFALYILFFSLVTEKNRRIRICKAFRQAFRIGGQQFAGTMKFLIVEACMMLICLAPLLFLLEKRIWFLAGLTVPMWLLLMNPVRMNAAAAMQEAMDGGKLFTGRLLETDDWWGKVWIGIRRTLCLAVWSVPLAAGAAYAYRLWKGADDMDGFTLLQSVQDFGGGDVKTGILYIGLIAGGLLLLLVIGCAYHSGARHAAALGIPRRTGSHHGKIVIGWFLSLIILWPILIVSVIPAGVIQTLLMDTNGLFTNTVKLPNIKALLIVLGGGMLMTLPLIPFRSLVIAAMVHQLKEDREKAAS